MVRRIHLDQNLYVSSNLCYNDFSAYNLPQWLFNILHVLRKKKIKCPQPDNGPDEMPAISTKEYKFGLLFVLIK